MSYIITNFIEKAMSAKELNLFVTSDGKYLAMNEQYDTVYKFDLLFSDSDFSCQILAGGAGGVVLKHAVNVPWTNGAGIRAFMDYVNRM
jgi:hypothetical protein